MAYGVYFAPASMDAGRYDAVIQKLEEAGAGNPKGRVHHSCFGTGDQLKVYDIWESMEDFRKFGETLMPILAEVGIDAGKPTIMEIHNVIEA